MAFPTLVKPAVDPDAEPAEPAARATWASSASWTAATLPARPWIAPGYLLRGAVTSVVGPGGVSKSSLMVAWAVALVLGEKFHGLHPKDKYRVVLFNVEDDDDEQRRRLTGILTSRGKQPEDIEDRLMRVGPERVGLLLDRDSEGGAIFRTNAMLELIANVKAFQADVLILDPLAELHAEDENANVALREVIAEFRSLAKELNIALVLVHHTRKGMIVPGDMDASRGASSIISASRVGLTVVSMTPEEEKALGLGIDTRKHYFRLDGGKSNYHALTDCEWFERVSYDLGQGDTVGVPVPWTPPVDSITPSIRVAIEAAIEMGSPNGPWSPRLENRPRSIKHAMIEAGITTAPGQKDLLAALLRDGFDHVKFRDENRKWALGIRSPDGKPSNVTWSGDDGEDA